MVFYIVQSYYGIMQLEYFVICHRTSLGVYPSWTVCGRIIRVKLYELNNITVKTAGGPNSSKPKFFSHLCTYYYRTFKVSSRPSSERVEHGKKIAERVHAENLRHVQVAHILSTNERMVSFDMPRGDLRLHICRTGSGTTRPQSQPQQRCKCRKPKGIHERAAD
jgi:hypothetical protein